MVDQDDADKLLWAGHDLQERGDHAGALVCFDKALKLQPKDARLWIAKGACLTKLRHWDSAIDAFQRGIKLRPAYAEADARLMLANALASAGRTKEAKKEYVFVSKMEACYPSYDEPIDEAKAALKKLGAK